ncbi:hypothetical protein GQR58_018706 [Nymphon striatum]|nr:hypothetical protein GQR58_018706 [Nymphon striatum]
MAEWIKPYVDIPPVGTIGLPYINDHAVFNCPSHPKLLPAPLVRRFQSEAKNDDNEAPNLSICLLRRDLVNYGEPLRAENKSMLAKFLFSSTKQQYLNGSAIFECWKNEEDFRSWVWSYCSTLLAAMKTGRSCANNNRNHLIACFLEGREQLFYEFIILMRILRISWTDMTTHTEVLQRMGLQETFLLQSILKRKASFFGHIARGSAGEELRMIVAEGWRKVGRGRRRRRWMDDLELVTGTTDVRRNMEMAEDREQSMSVLEKRQQMQKTDKCKRKKKKKKKASNNLWVEINQIFEKVQIEKSCKKVFRASLSKVDVAMVNNNQINVMQYLRRCPKYFVRLGGNHMVCVKEVSYRRLGCKPENSLDVARIAVT